MFPRHAMILQADSHDISLIIRSKHVVNKLGQDEIHLSFTNIMEPILYKLNFNFMKEFYY